MSLLVADTALSKRRDVTAGPLAPLAQSLARDLEPLLSREVYFPTEKALLSREGGRCPRHGVLLDFDPFAPHEHRCPIGGEVFRGELHDRFWIYWYQLWLAERAVHAAALWRVGVDARFADLAARILEGYSERYASYPNVDNVLGPTRLFFSTYLESIWLLQICIATDLLGANAALADRVRDRIVEPSRAIIAGYDEHGSNRQVWNAAALLAAARVLGDTAAAERAVLAPSGVAWQIESSLLADGTWYEGENYHLFAHRGLWYGVLMAEQAGIELSPALSSRFELGFTTPFLTALPDFTLPSRRDSQYKISLRQWRIAEHCELGVARRADPTLVGALSRMYDDDVPRRETGRRTSSADVERNTTPSSLTRADLSWRALLCACATLPPLTPIAPRSALLDSQGIAVFRRNSGRTYVALDYGHAGGGHGHPDRLNVLLADGTTRWLDDAGTGSYVDPTLHWYRSTLAHNAPLVNGASQIPVDGVLSAYDERAPVGWIEAVAEGIAPGVRATRTLVVTPEYLIDELVVAGPAVATIDLPLHADIALQGAVSPPSPGTFEGGAGMEDGFRFVQDAQRQEIAAGAVVHGAATHGDEKFRVWAQSDQRTEWWRVRAPGPPGAGERYFRVLRTRGRDVRHRFVVAWSPDVTAVDLGESVRVTMAGGSVHQHRRTKLGWRVELGSTMLELGGRVARAADEPRWGAAIESRRSLRLKRGVDHTIDLSEAHYRRSELSWHEAGMPVATITFRADTGLRLTVDVPRSDRTFAAANAVNRYDNEHADINGDGVQLHLRTTSGLANWMLIPERGDDSVRVRAIGAVAGAPEPRAHWRTSPHGYRMEVEIAPVPLAIDVVVNEMPVGRERRRGQLVLSGAAGEFVYLRGDRHDADRLIALQVDDA